MITRTYWFQSELNYRELGLRTRRRSNSWRSNSFVWYAIPHAVQKNIPAPLSVVFHKFICLKQSQQWSHHHLIFSISISDSHLASILCSAACIHVPTASSATTSWRSSRRLLVQVGLYLWSQVHRRMYRRELWSTFGACTWWKAHQSE